MFDFVYDSRILLVYLAVKYEGDYQKIITALNLNENVPYEEAMNVYNSLKCKVVTLLDYDYPQKLKRICHPPVVLFYYGDLSLFDRQIVATVGTRDCSEYGKTCTEKIAGKLSKGRVIISGLAKGVDAYAHEAAIKSGGRTIAVLGSGIDNCYPFENKELYEEIKKNHLVISEYPGMTPPNKWHFPCRNRIVVQTADAIFIPEIKNYMSGTMISITLSLEQGIEVFVAYHPINDGTINNQLISEGAFPVEDADQILYELGWQEK